MLILHGIYTFIALAYYYMKSKFCIIIAFICANFLFSKAALSQETFSIVAADSATIEIGSAGASCVDLFEASTVFPYYSEPNFLSVIVPNKTGINIQSSFDTLNKANAIRRILAGDSPSEMLYWLFANDADNDTTMRQYGAVGFVNGLVEKAAFTGSECFDYKGHLFGQIGGFHYCIQGNILKGKEVLTAMESRFRNTNGNLKCRLMAAMQGANSKGADIRCESNNTSSLFAFLQVVQPNDIIGKPSFYISVKTPNLSQIEPIDSLQKLFTKLQICSTMSATENIGESAFYIYPNPSISKSFLIHNNTHSLENYSVRINDMMGRTVTRYYGRLSNQSFNTSELNKGIYQLLIYNKESLVFTQKLIVN